MLRSLVGSEMCIRDSQHVPHFSMAPQPQRPRMDPPTKPTIHGLPRRARPSPTSRAGTHRPNTGKPPTRIFDGSRPRAHRRITTPGTMHPRRSSDHGAKSKTTTPNQINPATLQNMDEILRNLVSNAPLLGFALLIGWHWVNDLRKRLDRCERDHKEMRNMLMELIRRQQ